LVKAWKAAEKAVARILNGERISNKHLGASCADVVAGAFSVECKEREKIPLWLIRAIEQSERNARGGRTAIVELHEKGQRYYDDLVIMRLSSFIEWHGELKPAEPEVVLAQNEVGE
jgi:hypothetical protein